MAIPNLFKKKAVAEPDPVKLSDAPKSTPLIPKDQMHPVGSHVGAADASLILGSGLGGTLEHLITAVYLPHALAQQGSDAYLNGDGAGAEGEDGLDGDDPEAQAAELDVFDDYQGPDNPDSDAFDAPQELGNFANPSLAIEQYIKDYAGKLSPAMIVQKVKLKFGLSESVAQEEVHVTLVALHKKAQELKEIEQALLVEQAKLAVPPPITMAVKDIDPDAMLELLGQQMKKQMNKDQT